MRYIWFLFTSFVVWGWGVGVCTSFHCVWNSFQEGMIIVYRMMMWGWDLHKAWQANIQVHQVPTPSKHTCVQGCNRAEPSRHSAKLELDSVPKLEARNSTRAWPSFDFQARARLEKVLGTLELGSIRLDYSNTAKTQQENKKNKQRQETKTSIWIFTLEFYVLISTNKHKQLERTTRISWTLKYNIHHSNFHPFFFLNQHLFSFPMIFITD